MSAVPIPDPDLGAARSSRSWKGVCHPHESALRLRVFRTRCPVAGPECAKTRPQLEGNFDHAVSCLKVDPLSRKEPVNDLAARP